MFAPTLVEWATYAGNVSRLSYALLVPVLALVLALRAPAPRADAPTQPGSPLGPILYITAAGLLVAGSLTALLTLCVAAIPVAITGWVASTGGSAALRRQAPALVLLAAMVPVPTPLLDLLTPWLVAHSGAGAIALLGPFDAGASWIGSELVYRGWTLIVAEACSGSGTLFTLGVLGLFFGGMFEAGRYGTGLLFALALPLTLAVNSARIAVTALLLDGLGPEAVTGTPHELLGQLLILATAAVVALAVERTVRRLARTAPGQEVAPA